MNNLEGALPYGRELVQPFPGEHPPEHEVTYLKCPRVDVAAMILSRPICDPIQKELEGPTKDRPAY